MSVFSLIIVAAIRFSIVSHLEFLTKFSHGHCLERLPQAASALPELKALACGENFSSLTTAQLFIATGLIHLFVVSGTHLVVLQKIFFKFAPQRSPWAQFIFLLILFLYAGVCEFNAPVTRSLLAIFTTMLLSSRKLYWPWYFKTLLVGLLTLSLNPQWIQSISLQLSWLAALTLGLNQHLFRERSILFKQTIFFIMLFPLLIYLQIPSPIIIVINIVFSPVLEFILFPLSILVWVFPRLYPVFDFMITFLKTILSLVNLNFTPQIDQPPLYFCIFIWIFIFFVHVGIHVYSMKLKLPRKVNI
ncbi:MAG: ComEC/Rec2 family competence protein [Bdellovibrionaceae bacterium]|nr:ComEC/Rec2 family competence protein [Bdellovibrio sp.]